MTDIGPVVDQWAEACWPRLMRLATAVNRLGAQGLEVRSTWRRDGYYLRLWLPDDPSVGAARAETVRLGFVVTLVSPQPRGPRYDGFQMCVFIPTADVDEARAAGMPIGPTNELEAPR